MWQPEPMGNSGSMDTNRGAGTADREPGVVLCSDLDAEQSTRVAVLLQAMGIEPAVMQTAASPRFEVRVHEREASAARALLREEFPYGFSPGVDPIPPRAPGRTGMCTALQVFSDRQAWENRIALRGHADPAPDQSRRSPPCTK